MDEEYLYIGIRRWGIWHVYPAAVITEEELAGVDVLRDLQSTMILGALAHTAKTKVIWQATFGFDPFAALNASGKTCRGLELVREYVRRARERARP